MKLFRSFGQSRRRRALNSSLRIAEQSLEPRQMLSGVSVEPPEAASIAVEAVSSSGGSFSETEILVRFHDDFDVTAHIEAERSLTGPSIIGQLGAGFDGDPQLFEIPVSAPEHLQVMVDHMQSLEAVEIASPNPTLSFAAVPNDPQIGSQWWVEAINAPAAWDIRTDSSDVIVAVADSGITAHPDLVDNLWVNEGEIWDNGIDDDGNGYVDDLIGWDGAFNTPQVGDIAELKYHGTSVSGVVGASGNNARGVSGVSWDASLMTVRGWDFSHWIRGIDYAIQNGAKVVNNSWRFFYEPAGLRAVFERAEQAGVLMVTAAGNEAWDVEGSQTTNNSSFDGLFDLDSFWPDLFTPQSGSQTENTAYPAEFSRDFDNVITVAATDPSGQLARFSSWGRNTVQLAAPGEGILTTNGAGGYHAVDGTSFASPIVASAAALVWAERPELTAPEVKQILLDSAQPRLLDKVTNGVLDLHGALQTARNMNLTDATVFDARTYLQLNPDVAQAVGADNLAGATDHWLRFGLNEGRVASAAFNVQLYRDLNPDLVAVHGRDNYQAMLLHWLDHGIDEGRLASTVFDVKLYQEVNPDLAESFGTNNYRALMTHWLDYGIAEGRVASTLYDSDFYEARHTDLVGAFGRDNHTALLNHWLQYGIWEGRRASATFDVRHYQSVHADVTKALGHGNYNAMLTHWLQYGLREGRESSREFDVAFYLNSHPDLSSYYGAGNHHGALTHFVRHGKGEGRGTNEQFNIDSYRQRYDDLNTAYGRNFHGLWDHWFYFGIAEGRDPS